MTDRAQTALVAIRRIIRATELHAKRLAREAGLNTTQVIVLQIVASAGEANAGRIAEAAKLSQATVTNLLDKLQKRGLVRRRRGEVDRRQVWVELTQEGRELLAGVPDTLQNRFRAQFSKTADWEQAFLVAALERVAALLDAEEIDASPVLDVGAIDRPVSRNGDE